MRRRLRWQLSQWKLLYYPLSAIFYWLVRGLFEEFLFSSLAEWARGKAGWVMAVVTWAEQYPDLSLGVLFGIFGLVILVLVIKDARKRVKGIYGIDDVLLEMFNIGLASARMKASEIKADAQWDRVMKAIAKDVVFIDAAKYAGRDMTDKRERAEIEGEVRELTPTDEDTVPIFKLIASAMVNNGYGIEEKDLGTGERYRVLQQRLAVLRKVPSTQVNSAIDKCLDYVYTLINIYIYHLVIMRDSSRLGQRDLAQMRNFVHEQETNTGDMSRCLAELRVEIDKFAKGGRSAKRD